MSTEVIRKGIKVPKIGRYSTAVINDANEGRNIIDDMRMARRQPMIWQPHLKSIEPGWKMGRGVDSDDWHGGAVLGDLGFHEGGLCGFNSRVMKDLHTRTRHSLRENFKKLPQLNASIRQSMVWEVNSDYLAASVDKRFFTANRACIVRAHRLTVTVAGTDGGAVTAIIRKVPSGTAITGGTTIHSGTNSYNLKGTADTVQVGDLNATASNYTLAAGDSLAVDFTGTLTSATGSLTVEVEETGVSDAGGNANSDFEILGTNAVNGSATFAVNGGVTLTTGATANDQAYLNQHLDTGISAWAASQWSTAKRLLFEAAIETGVSVASMLIWAGIKLTQPSPFSKTTDNDQLIIWFDTSVDVYMHYTYSIANVDVSGILTAPDGTKLAVAASTLYWVEIGVDEARLPYIVVNGVMYLSGATALTSLTTMKPAIGVQTLTTAAKVLTVHDVCMSRDI